MAAQKAKHSKVPPENWECKATMEEITEKDGNFVEYMTVPSNTWHPCGFSKTTVQYLQSTGFNKYIQDVEKASKDCAAAVKRLITKGPPLYLSDDIAMPVPEGDTHVELLWFADDDKEVSAKLTGALEGKEREALWSSQKETLQAMLAAEEALKSAEATEKKQ